MLNKLCLCRQALSYCIKSPLCRDHITKFETCCISPDSQLGWPGLCLASWSCPVWGYNIPSWTASSPETREDVSHWRTPLAATSTEATTPRMALRVSSGPTGLLRRIMAGDVVATTGSGPLGHWAMIARPHTPPIAPSWSRDITRVNNGSGYSFIYVV